jgi:hypothetical protein
MAPLLLLLALIPGIANAQIDAIELDLDFDDFSNYGSSQLEDEDEDNRFVLGVPLTPGALGPEEDGVEGNPFALLPAKKRKHHEMLAADLYFNLLTKFVQYMILVSSLPRMDPRE